MDSASFVHTAFTGTGSIIIIQYHTYTICTIDILAFAYPPAFLIFSKFKNFFYVGVYLINNDVLAIRCTAKWFSYTHISIHSFLILFPFIHLLSLLYFTFIILLSHTPSKFYSSFFVQLSISFLWNFFSLKITFLF